MRRCARWIPLFAVVAALPVLAADDDPKKPAEPDKKEMTKDAKPEPKKEPDKVNYVQVATIANARVKKFDTKSSEVSVEHMIGFGKGAHKQTEELTLAEDVKVLTRIHPETVGDDGKPKKIVGAELAKLREPKFKDCYKSDVNQVKPGMTVEVVVSKPKETGPKKSSAKGKADDKDNLVVTLVIIVAAESPVRTRSVGKTPEKK